MASAIGSRGLAGEFPFLDTIDAAALASILQRNAPFLESDDGLQLLGKGYYSFVFATANGWIVRVARTDDAAERHELEISLLPLVAPTLPVALPQPVRALEPCEVGPFGAVAYRRLPGDLMTEADASSPAGAAIATDLGTALAALHAIDPALLLVGGMPTASAHHLAMLRRETRPIRERLTAAEWERVNSWWDELFASRLLNSGALAPAHGDPWWENLTIENGRLAGILDWEFLSLSDPANDVGVALQMGEGFFLNALAAYRSASTRADPTLEPRARALFASRTFYGIAFAIRRNDEAEWQDSLRKLREGPVLRAPD